MYHVCKCVSEYIYDSPSGRRSVSGSTESALIPSCLTWGLQPPDPLLGALAYITADARGPNLIGEEGRGHGGGEGSGGRMPSRLRGHSKEMTSSLGDSPKSTVFSLD